MQAPVRQQQRITLWGAWRWKNGWTNPRSASSYSRLISLFVPALAEEEPVVNDGPRALRFDFAGIRVCIGVVDPRAIRRGPIHGRYSDGRPFRPHNVDEWLADEVWNHRCGRSLGRRPRRRICATAHRRYHCRCRTRRPPLAHRRFSGRWLAVRRPGYTRPDLTSGGASAGEKLRSRRHHRR